MAKEITRTSRWRRTHERIDRDVKRERERQVSDRSRWRGERDSSVVHERSIVEERERERRTYVALMSDLLRGHVGQHPFHTFHFVVICRLDKCSASSLHPPTIPFIIHSSPQPKIPRPTSFVVIVNNGDAATARVSEREREREGRQHRRAHRKRKTNVTHVTTHHHHITHVRQTKSGNS